MVCVLYKSCLVLANPGRFFTPYNVVASIALANGSIEEPDNGRGEVQHLVTINLTYKFCRSPMSHGATLLEVGV